MPGGVASTRSAATGRGEYLPAASLSLPGTVAVRLSGGGFLVESGGRFLALRVLRGSDRSE